MYSSAPALSVSVPEKLLPGRGDEDREVTCTLVELLPPGSREEAQAAFWAGRVVAATPLLVAASIAMATQATAHTVKARRPR
jgi:hypothetical protein